MSGTRNVRATFTYALFPHNSDAVKIVVNDFCVKKCCDIIDILRGEAAIDNSRVLVPVCCFPESLHKVMTNN